MLVRFNPFSSRINQGWRRYFRISSKKSKNLTFVYIFVKRCQLSRIFSGNQNGVKNHRFSVENDQFLPNCWKRHSRFNEIGFSWPLAKKRDQDLRGTRWYFFCSSKLVLASRVFRDTFKKCHKSMLIGYLCNLFVWSSSLALVSSRGMKKSIGLGEKYCCRHPWKLVTHFRQLQQWFYPNFNYSKSTKNVRKFGFYGYYPVRQSVFCRYKSILRTWIKVDKTAFMDENWKLPQCGFWALYN